MGCAIDVSGTLALWAEAGESISASELVQLASVVTTNKTIIDPNDSIFIHPGKMVERISYLASQSGQEVPQSKGEIARCIYESLAVSYKKVIAQLEEVTKCKFKKIRVVGGGSANDLLNQLTATTTGITLTAGPVEATLLGNVGVQAIIAGEISGLSELRKVIRDSFELKEFRP